MHALAMFDKICKAAADEDEFAGSRESACVDGGKDDSRYAWECRLHRFVHF